MISLISLGYIFIDFNFDLILLAQSKQNIFIDMYP